MAGRLVGALRYDCADRMAAKPAANPLHTVCFVTGKAPGTAARAAHWLGNPYRVHQHRELGGFVPLGRRRFDGKGQASAVSNQVELCAESAS